MSESTLSLLDYTLFLATLILSISIGIYHGCFANRQRTLSEYLWGNKKMKIIPVAISVAVRFYFGTTLLGASTEVYRHGGVIWWNNTAHIFMAFVAIFIYLPVFFNLRLISVYEYLELRFDRKIRILALVFYVIGELLQTAISLYTPSVIISTASGMSVFTVAAILAAVCVLYTTLGGLKTVVWTDVLQFFIIIIIIIISLGFILFARFHSLKDFTQMWKTAIDGKRLDIFNFNFNPMQRDNFWNFFFGYGFAISSAIIVHQTGIQKFLSLPSYKKCIWTLFYNYISMLVVYSFCLLIGLKMFYIYKDCDPYLSKKIQKHDQLLPFYVTEIASSLPGISGLFLAAMCSGALSSVSSNLNAFSGIVYKDILCLLLKKTPSKKKAGIILKVTILIVGITIPFLVVAATYMDEIFTIAPVTIGSTKALLMGIFTLGILFPRANSKGAFCGIFLGLVSMLAIAVPSKLYQMKGLIRYPPKPLSVSGCNITNFTQTSYSTTFNNQEVPAIFRISFYLYSVISTCATIFFGLIISYLSTKKTEVDSKLLCPVTHWFLRKKTKNDGKGDYSQVEKFIVET